MQHWHAAKRSKLTGIKIGKILQLKELSLSIVHVLYVHIIEKWIPGRVYAYIFSCSNFCLHEYGLVMYLSLAMRSSAIPRGFASEYYRCKHHRSYATM